VELIVEVGLRGTAAGNMVWDVSHWDAGATWSATEPTWSVLPGAEVESLSISRGRRSGLSRNSAGTGSVGLVWPSAKGGHWSFRAGSPVHVGWELRIRASVDGRAAIPLYRGTVRRVKDSWARGTFRLQAELVDRLADLGAVDLPEAASASGLGDLTHARILRILGLAGINTAYASMGTGFDDSGTVTHASSTFARNLLDEAMTTMESEAGSDLLVDREGRITFRRAHWWEAIAGHAANARWNATRATWTNLESSAPYSFDVIEPGGFGSGSDLDDIRNRVSAARTGGSAIVAEAPDSQIRYGMRTFQRFDLTCQSDAAVTAFANLYIAQLAERTDRLDAIASELDPRRPAAELERYLDVELGDRHAIAWNDGDGTMDGTFHVHGIRLRVDPNRFRMELDLWAYAGFGLAPGSVWGSAVWGSSRWQ
jgi:hypothetical protein